MAQLGWIWLSLGRVWINWGWVAQLGMGDSVGDGYGSIGVGMSQLGMRMAQLGMGMAELGIGCAVRDGMFTVGNGVAHLG